MATTINAGTATGGAAISADTTGILQLQSGSTPTTAVTIDASQNVGIGTSSPVSVGGYGALTLNGTTGSLVYLQNNATSALQIATNSSGAQFSALGASIPMYFVTNGAERVRIDTAGNVGIGTSNPSYKLQVAPGGSGADQLAVFNDTTNAWTANGGTVLADYYAQTTLISGIKMSSGSPTSGYLTFHTNGITERMRIDGSGNVLVGATTGGDKVNITYDGSAQFGISLKSTSASASQIYFYTSTSTVAGSIFSSGSTTNYVTSSDYRLKDITGNITGYKERIMSLQPKQGTWKTDGSEFKGFVAHEFAQQYPNAVSGKKDAVDAEGKPIYQGMQAGGSETIADLVALAQEQQALITDLTTRLSALEAK